MEKLMEGFFVVWLCIVDLQWLLHKLLGLLLVSIAPSKVGLKLNNFLSAFGYTHNIRPQQPTSQLSHLFPPQQEFLLGLWKRTCYKKKYSSFFLFFVHSKKYKK
jgi:hypothetical protein